MTSKLRSFLAAYQRSAGYRMARAQIRFSAFTTAMLLSLATVTFAVLTVVVAVVAHDTVGILVTAISALVCGVAAAALWRVRRWWWPPIRDEDRFRLHDQ